MTGVKNKEKQYPTYIILGSGGHTGEMCKIQKALLNSKDGDIYKPIRYLVAHTDNTSCHKLTESFEDTNITSNDYEFINVPRSREVGQSWFTTIFSTIWSLFWSCYLVWRDQPRLILCNGPGTCVPFCVATFVLRWLRYLSPKTKIVFVESFCRVKTLSLSGRLLLPIADMFVVQWPQLAEIYKRKTNIRYFGRIM